jgi:formylglycine-generating enzyme required for sulfatase activity
MVLGPEDTDEEDAIVAARNLERLGATKSTEDSVERLVARIDRFKWFTAKTPSELRLELLEKWSALPLPTPPRNAAWLNSLQMGFVEIGKLLVSIYETRCQDYLAFVVATKRNESNGRADKGKLWGPESWQEPNHPAVRISWADAKAFCEWLTQKEQAAGLLQPGMHYRLPTDQEWSAFVGLHEESGETPFQKMENSSESFIFRRAVHFPWGTSFPPRHAAGNYGKIESLVDDEFPKTAPVGSFSQNEKGLYDLGGNVSEWCEDLWGNNLPEARDYRVQRGGSWQSEFRIHLNSYTRLPSSYTASGFRVVLERR